LRLAEVFAPVSTDASARQPQPSPGESLSPGTARGQILIVEPDPLTQWSLKAYLQKWFNVDGTSSTSTAQQFLEKHAVDALILSEELPPTALAALEQRAHSFNARVAIIRTVTDSSFPRRPGSHTGYLEKPFELSQLARLLGIPDGQLPNGRL
jgi:DNA-binding response OmpR family regulator